MPETLAMSKVDGKPILQNNDYDYETDTFSFFYDDSTQKIRRHLQYFEDLGQIDKSFTEEGMQTDIYTRYPYMPVQLDSRYGMPTGTDLAGDIFTREELGQPNVMGRYKLSEDFTPSHFEGSVAVKALYRLRQQRRDDGRAWFLTASFHSPHAPFVAAWKHLQKYWENRDQLLVPISLNDSMDDSAYKPVTDDLPRYSDEASIQEWTALYYALIEEVDDCVGLLLEALGEDASNTLIVFTSDHGEMLGSHGMREKNNFYEESSRVPLFISYPGVIPPDTHVKDHVGHIDLVATILDFVGAPEMDRTDGHSLRPMIQRNNDMINRDFDQSVSIGEWDYRKPLGTDLSQLERSIDERPSFMVVKAPYKLMMQKLSDSDELDMMYNLNQDPFERNNLLGRNAMNADTGVVAKAEHMRCLLLDWMQRLDGGINGDKAYFSDSANNYNDRGGDINEIRNRQQWKTLGLWTSAGLDDPLVFGQVSWTGSEFIRHEWLYTGNRKDESLTIVSASLTGKDSVFFSVDEDAVIGRVIERNSCESIRITFRANVWAETAAVDATLLLTLNYSDSDHSVTRRIPLVLGDMDFEAHRTLETPEDESANTANNGNTGCRLGGDCHSTTERDSSAKTSQAFSSVPSILLTLSAFLGALGF